MTKIGIIGASGYGGGELIRMLAAHPHVSLQALVSETYAGKPPAAAFAGLRGRLYDGLLFESFGEGASLGGCDLVFSAQDNGKAMTNAQALLEAGCKIVDLSADFRLANPNLYPTWYGFTHSSPALLATAVYGLPELNAAAIRSAMLVGNPGCYPTASILALAPLVSAGLIDCNTIIIDAKSGVSGAGRSKHALEYHFPEANENVSAYKVGGGHRHVPEIEQSLSMLAGHETVISFTPHLVPISRGILATCYAKLTGNTDVWALRKRFEEFYSNAPFVYIYPEGTPAAKSAHGSNGCHIGVEVDVRTGRIIVISAIDNLVKGMAGQAIQNMNLMCGFEETAGLESGGIWP